MSSSRHVWAWAILLASAVTSRAAVEYSITDLGWGKIPLAINNHGQVAGLVYVRGVNHHAFRTDATGALIDLGTLGGVDSAAEDLNDAGQTAGWSLTPSGANRPLAIRTERDGAIANLATSGGAASRAYAINNTGQIVGRSGPLLIVESDPAGRAFRTDAAGIPRDLGTLGGAYSAARDINASGQVAGHAETSDVVPGGYRTVHVFRTDAAGVMSDLGTLGGSWGEGRAINDAGQVAGTADTPFDADYHAFRTTPSGAMADLGTLGGLFSRGYGINGGGVVVGDSLLPGDFTNWRAFVYRDVEGMVDLNTLIPPDSGWSLQQAVDVNDLGQIVGSGLIGGEVHGFVLTPVPEPAWSAYLLAGLCGALFLRRARRQCRRAAAVGAFALAVSTPWPGSAASAAVEYTVTNLGTFGGSNSLAYALNNAGSVVGVARTTPGDVLQAFRTDAAGLIQPVAPLAPGSHSVARAVNDGGQVAGHLNNRAFRADASGMMTSLGGLDGVESGAYGMNGLGQVVGYIGYPAPTEDDNTTTRAFRTDAVGVMTKMGTLGGVNSWALGINDAGLIVGYADDARGRQRAFRTDAAGVLHDLGTLGGPSGRARAINAAGQTVGNADTAAGSSHAFRTDTAGLLYDLGTLGGGDSTAIAINDLGAVVGTSAVPGGVTPANPFGYTPFVYDDARGMRDLNELIAADSGWFLVEVAGINDRGQIAGYGVINNQTRAFLLTPVPEPAPLWSLAAAVAAAVTLRRPIGAGIGNPYAASRS
jgi:probable HAF family extracellular repeat protein